MYSDKVHKEEECFIDSPCKVELYSRRHAEREINKKKDRNRGVRTIYLTWIDFLHASRPNSAVAAVLPSASVPSNEASAMS